MSRRGHSKQRKRAVAEPKTGVDALTALDLVRGRLSEIEALASSANDRIDAIPVASPSAISDGCLPPRARRPDPACAWA